jgi:hypothetical protein
MIYFRIKFVTLNLIIYLILDPPILIKHFMRLVSLIK